MVNSELLGRLDNERNPFLLKRSGHFDESLYAYADEYADSMRRGSNFIAELCFDQMFDIALLILLQEGKIFETRAQLLSAIEDELSRTLEEKDAYRREDFHKRFASCRKKLLVKGRAKTPFSVSTALLVQKERRKLLAGQ